MTAATRTEFCTVSLTSFPPYLFRADEEDKLLVVRVDRRDGRGLRLWYSFFWCVVERVEVEVVSESQAQRQFPSLTLLASSSLSLPLSLLKTHRLLRHHLLGALASLAFGHRDDVGAGRGVAGELARRRGSNERRCDGAAPARDRAVENLEKGISTFRGKCIS